MDLSGIATFDTIDGWVQFLFSHLLKDQPRGYSKVSLHQIVDCHMQLFIMASHLTMGKLTSSPADKKPLDEAILPLKSSSEILQYVVPLQTLKTPDPPVKTDNCQSSKDWTCRWQRQRCGEGKKIFIPDDCSTHDAEGKPVCFKFQTGKCSFKEPAGKRCAKGYHKCYKKGCYRLKPHYQCNHADWQQSGFHNDRNLEVARNKQVDNPAASAMTLNSAQCSSQTTVGDAKRRKVSRGPPLYVELFAGKATLSLSRALIQSGFEVISIDHIADSPMAPMSNCFTGSYNVIRAADFMADFIQLGIPSLSALGRIKVQGQRAVRAGAGSHLVFGKKKESFWVWKILSTAGCGQFSFSLHWANRWRTNEPTTVWKWCDFIPVAMGRRGANILHGSVRRKFSLRWMQFVKTIILMNSGGSLGSLVSGSLLRQPSQPIPLCWHKGGQHAYSTTCNISRANPTS